MIIFQGDVAVTATIPQFVTPPDGPVIIVPVAGPPGPVGPKGVAGIAGTDAFIQSHVESEAPHPAYDDGPSFVLLYENAKV